MYKKRKQTIGRMLVEGAVAVLVLASPLAGIGTAKADVSWPEVQSVNASGDKADLGAGEVQMSRDGRYVAFMSPATNLGRQRTTGGNTNPGPMAVYLHDRVTGATTLESLNTAGQQENGNALSYKLAGDGRHMILATDANNMGQSQQTTGATNIYLRNLDLHTTTQVNSYGDGNISKMSVSNDGMVVSYGARIRNTATGDSISACTTDLTSMLSGNGQYSFYETYDTHTSTGQAYRCNLSTGDTVLVSARPDGGLSNGTTGIYGVSDDGNRVVLNSTSTTFLPDGRPGSGAGRFYVRDISLGTTQRVDVKSDGTDATEEGANFTVGISGDGNMAYIISSKRLTDGPFASNGYHVYARDLATGTITSADRNAWGAPADSEAYSATMNHDGSLVGFESNATNFGNYDHYYGQVYVEPTAPYTGVTDTTAPSIANLNWADNPVVTGTDVSFTVNVSDDLSGVARAEYWIDSDGSQGSGIGYAHPLTRVNDTTFTGVVISQNPGIHQIGVRVMDNGNNWSDSTLDYLVVYDAGKTKMRGQGTFVPAYGMDVLPGLISSGQTDKGRFGMLIVYKNGVVDTTKSALTFSYKTGTHCTKPSASNCHTMSLASSAVSWLVLDQENSSHGTMQGTADVTIDGVTTSNPIRVEGIDGARLSSPLIDHYAIRVYAPGANPNTAQPIYQAAGDLVRGDVRIVAPVVTPPPPQQ